MRGGERGGGVGVCGRFRRGAEIEAVGRCRSQGAEGWRGRRFGLDLGVRGWQSKTLMSTEGTEAERGAITMSKIRWGASLDSRVERGKRELRCYVEYDHIRHSTLCRIIFVLLSMVVWKGVIAASMSVLLAVPVAVALVHVFSKVRMCRVPYMESWMYNAYLDVG